MIVLRCDLFETFSDFPSRIWFGFIGNYGRPKPTSPRPGGKLPYRDALSEVAAKCVCFPLLTSVSFLVLPVLLQVPPGFARPAHVMSTTRTWKTTSDFGRFRLVLQVLSLGLL